MLTIESQRQFDQLVRRLADEFEHLTAVKTKAGASQKIAWEVLINYREPRASEDTGYAVRDTAQYANQQINATQGDVISPYDVFRYTDDTVLGDMCGTDNTAATAAHLLARQIRIEWDDE